MFLESGRPNWSLNRTLCGSPILGFKSLAQNRPTAKCRLARTLGRRYFDAVLHQRLRIQIMERQCSFNVGGSENQTLREPANPSDAKSATRRWQERSGTTRPLGAPAPRAGNERQLKHSARHMLRGASQSVTVDRTNWANPASVAYKSFRVVK